MIIDARTSDSTDGNYRQFTVRLALDNAIRATLTKPGDSLRIEKVIDADGIEMPLKNAQITLRQIIPKGWKLTTENDGTVLEIWRIR